MIFTVWNIRSWYIFPRNFNFICCLQDQCIQIITWKPSSAKQHNQPQIDLLNDWSCGWASRMNDYRATYLSAALRENTRTIASYYPKNSTSFRNLARAWKARFVWMSNRMVWWSKIRVLQFASLSIVWQIKIPSIKDIVKEVTTFAILENIWQVREWCHDFRKKRRSATGPWEIFVIRKISVWLCLVEKTAKIPRYFQNTTLLKFNICSPKINFNFIWELPLKWIRPKK